MGVHEVYPLFDGRISKRELKVFLSGYGVDAVRVTGISKRELKGADKGREDEARYLRNLKKRIESESAPFHAFGRLFERESQKEN